MGKISKRKPKHRQKSQDVDESISEPLENSRETVVQTIIDQLQAAEIEEKLCALQTVSILVEDQKDINNLLDQDLVKLIAPLLLDKVSSVRNEAAGCLRNLSASNSEICEKLVEQDIMTSLVCYFHEHAGSLVQNTIQKMKNDSMDTLVNCLNLLWNLCENSEVAVRYVENSKVLEILQKYLNLSAYHSDVVIVVLHILYVITEDNPKTAEIIQNMSEEVLLQLINLGNSDSPTMLVKDLASGVILNICRSDVAKLPANVINQIILVLASALSTDHHSLCKQITSVIPLIGEANIERPKTKEAKDLENSLKQLFQMLDAKQIAVEILTNLCSSEDNEESMHESESSDLDDEDDEDCLNDEGVIQSEDKLPPEILEALAGAGLFEKVWNNTQLPPENVVFILKESSQDLYQKLNNLQMNALFCINNMLSTLPLNQLGELNGVYKIWLEAGKIVFKQSSNNTDLIESATAVMRASLDKMRLNSNGTIANNTFFSELSLSDIQLMLDGIQQCQAPEVRSNLTRMIGILALLLTSNMDDTTCNVVSAIAEFILQYANKENEVWVLAEALDTLVDLFAEDRTDMLASKINLVDKLTRLLPIFKNKARNQRRLPGKYKVLIETVSSNLPRFIKYKKGRIINLKI